MCRCAFSPICILLCYRINSSNTLLHIVTSSFYSRLNYILISFFFFVLSFINSTKPSVSFSCVAMQIQWIDDSRRETIRTGDRMETQPLADGKRMRVVSRLEFTPLRSHHNSTITCLTSNQALTSPLSRWVGGWVILTYLEMQTI